MTETLQQQLYRCVFEGESPSDPLVDQIAESADAQAELVRLASVLANLPGDGARESEARLDALLEAVTLVAAGHVVTAHAYHGVTS
jgi:hypothetical protein